MQAQRQKWFGYSMLWCLEIWGFLILQAHSELRALKLYQIFPNWNKWICHSSGHPLLPQHYYYYYFLCHEKKPHFVIFYLPLPSPVTFHSGKTFFSILVELLYVLIIVYQKAMYTSTSFYGGNWLNRVGSAVFRMTLLLLWLYKLLHNQSMHHIWKCT